MSKTPPIQPVGPTVLPQPSAPAFTSVQALMPGFPTPEQLAALPPFPTSAQVIPLHKADKTRAQERWTGPVMDRGYSIVPTLLLWGQAKLGLSPEELNTLLQLISHWWHAGHDPHPSKDTIASRMGKHPRRVQVYLTSLEKKGLIKRVQRFKANKGQDANGYDLSGLVAKLEEIAPDFKKVADLNKDRRRRVEKPASA